MTITKQPTSLAYYALSIAPIDYNVDSASADDRPNIVFIPAGDKCDM